MPCIIVALIILDTYLFSISNVPLTDVSLALAVQISNGDLNPLFLDLTLVITALAGVVFGQRLGRCLGYAKQPIHSLKRDALRFGDEEPDEKEHTKAKAAEYEVCSVAHLVSGFEARGGRGDAYP